MHNQNSGDPQEEWYFQENGAPMGPLSWGEVDLFASTGRIKTQTPVCRGGDDAWITYEEARKRNLGASTTAEGSLFVSAKPSDNQEYHQRYKEYQQGIEGVTEASFLLRALARIIDLALVLSMEVGLAYLLLTSAAPILPLLLLSLLIPVLYDFAFHATLGATPGKLIFGLKVIREDGDKLNPRLAAFRSWLSSILQLFYIQLLFIVLIFRYDWRVVDRISGTYVIKRR